MRVYGRDFRQNGYYSLDGQVLAGEEKKKRRRHLDSERSEPCHDMAIFPSILSTRTPFARFALFGMDIRYYMEAEGRHRIND